MRWILSFILGLSIFMTPICYGAADSGYPVLTEIEDNSITVSNPETEESPNFVGPDPFVGLDESRLKTWIKIDWVEARRLNGRTGIRAWKGYLKIWI